MKRLGTFTAALLLTSALTSVYAQSPVSVIGSVSPGNCTQFFSITQIEDSGVTCGGAAAGLVIGTTTITARHQRKFEIFNNSGILGNRTARVVVDRQKSELLCQLAISGGTATCGRLAEA